jgi:hypothetical protein
MNTKPTLNTSTMEDSAKKSDEPVSADPNSGPADPLAHLNNSARQLLHAELPQKLEAVFRDKTIIHAQVKEVLSILKRTLEKPVCQRPSCFLVIGSANTGKTWLADKLFNDLGGDAAKRSGANDRMPLLIVETPARPTEPRIVLSLARAMGLPVVTENESRKVSDLILRKLRERRVRMVMLLEFDNIETLPTQERLVAFHFLKNITNQGISIVPLGTQTCVEYVLEDEQLKSRLRPLYLRGLARDKDYTDFVATLESHYPFPKPGFVWRDHVDKIFERTRGLIGETIMLLNEAAAWALRNGRPSIDAESLEKCDFRDQLTPLPGAKK